MRLAHLQTQFQRYLLGGESEIERHVVATDKASGTERLAIYGDAYRLRLLEVLDEDFPGLQGLLGAEAFTSLGRAYIDAYPSKHPSIRWFGRHLASFLGEASPYSEKPALAEMAAFEWAQGEVVDAADSNVCGVEQLAAVPPGCWPAMRVIFQHAMRRLELHWNVPMVWRAIHDGSAMPTLERRAQPLAWLLWRRSLQVHWRSLADDERWAIQACLDGRTFGEICQELNERSTTPDVALRAAALLKQWLSENLVAEIEPGQASS
jgi:hypothetical protein